MLLDDLDLEIVRILSGDGRASYSEISKAVGVSVSTVRNRVKQMRESGVLHLNVWLDPYRSGLGLNATLLLDVEAGRLEDVTTFLVGLDETGYVATLTGRVQANEVVDRGSVNPEGLSRCTAEPTSDSVVSALNAPSDGCASLGLQRLIDA